MARICVVLATYNGEKYLSKMLDSLVAQSRPADVIIAVDDGSKDSTCEILEKYRDTLPLQIEALPQNTGHRAAFSHALTLAQKFITEDDLIALADQDDVWQRDRLHVAFQGFPSGCGTPYSRRSLGSRPLDCDDCR